jgi:hypothetical protein
MPTLCWPLRRRLLSDHRKRAKRDGVAALDSGRAEMRVLLAENQACEYCRMPLSFAASIDHRHSIGRGGRHTLDN